LANCRLRSARQLSKGGPEEKGKVYEMGEGRDFLQVEKEKDEKPSWPPGKMTAKRSCVERKLMGGGGHSLKKDLDGGEWVTEVIALHGTGRGGGK